VYSFDLKAQATHSHSTLPPFINIQQFYVEGFLVERVAELGLADMRWQHRVEGLEQHADHASLRLSTPEGSYTLRARHVVDCSGSKSPFRAWVGASVHSKKGDDRWCIADVRFKTRPPVERHTWIEAPFNDNRAVWQHLMADGVWRLDYQMAPGCDLAEVSRLDVVLERLQKQFAVKLDVQRDCEVVWVGPYAYKGEHLEAMRHGRVFFVGDSAHVVSPFGARGGNSGVQDADNLAWKLAAVELGTAHPRLLDDYNAERLEAAEQNVSVTNRTARFLRPQDGVERTYRNAAIALAKHHPHLRAYVNTGRMSSPNTYSRSPSGTRAVCKAVQNAPLRWADGSAGDVVQLMQWAGAAPLLLWFGPMDVNEASALRRLHARNVRCVQVLRAGEPSQALEAVWEAGGEQRLRLTCQLDAGQLDADTTGTQWALIRPDAYVVATGTAVEHAEPALSRCLGHSA
jgi:3-(3-hydroxy-phenyl)propionate hydroxylase